jgi:tRNA nucleotidyltransferase (CCA-adding enzyme)
MNIFTVGGAVRDELLGLPVADRDHVVVGATPEEMTRLGYKPVGRDFPVFLHPATREEYALARTERKSGHGYKGFTFHYAPDVSLEEDLARRDLTINAMARDEAGRLIDPFGGKTDLEKKLLRHVGPAFAEDPVRILRVARFAARFPEFRIARDTMLFMRGMVENGEVDHLVPERVWQELGRGLMETRPSRMFIALRECGALKALLPELDRLFGVPQSPQTHPEIDAGVHTMRAIDHAARANQDLPVRFAVLTHDLGKGLTPREAWPGHDGHEQAGADLVRVLAARLRAPNDCRDLAILAARLHGRLHGALGTDASGILQLLEQADALRQPNRFRDLLSACEADFRGRPGFESREFGPSRTLLAALEAGANVDAGALAGTCTSPGEIRNKVRAARLRAIESAV